MRLDRFFTETATLSRSEAVAAIKRGFVSINGKIVTKPDQKIDENVAVVCYKNKQIKYAKYMYLMLNKPNGVVSATNDAKQKTVLDIVPQNYKKMNLFPCGRLDKDTLGLVILTNDGESAHRLLSPKHHVEKIYEFECADALKDEDKEKIENGILLKDGYNAKPCAINLLSDKKGLITLTEGKYHEIKRMFGAVGNKITFLKRISFGGIELDPKLKYGEFRELTENEISIFQSKHNN